jgi:hypothetical protein
MKISSPLGRKICRLRKRHCSVNGGMRSLMLASLRYYDTFVKMEGVWLSAERPLYMDWMDQRELP